MPLGSLRDKLDGSEIDLSLCNLTDVPVDELKKIPEATHLDLSCNQLQSLPNSFVSLTHVVKLDLSKNQLTSLPQDFGQLVNLQHLDLLDNGLTTLPDSFSQLTRLTWLDLKGNPLTEVLKKEAGKCGNEQECKQCAQNVLAYMNNSGSEKTTGDKKDADGKQTTTGTQHACLFSTQPLQQSVDCKPEEKQSLAESSVGYIDWVRQALWHPFS